MGNVFGRAIIAVYDALEKQLQKKNKQTNNGGHDPICHASFEN